MIHAASGTSRRLGQLRLALVLLPVLLITLAGSLSVAQEAVELEARVFELAGQLRCPVCTSESVAESSSPTSLEMREMIQEQIALGRSDAEVLAYFQDRYGDWILLEPPKRGLHLLVWILPAVVGAAALVTLFIYIRRWTKAGSQPVEVDPEDRDRVRRALGESQ